MLAATAVLVATTASPQLVISVAAHIQSTTSSHRRNGQKLLFSFVSSLRLHRALQTIFISIYFSIPRAVWSDGRLDGNSFWRRTELYSSTKHTCCWIYKLLFLTCPIRFIFSPNFSVACVLDCVAFLASPSVETLVCCLATRSLHFMHSTAYATMYHRFDGTAAGISLPHAGVCVRVWTCEPDHADTHWITFIYLYLVNPNAGR